MVSKRIEARRSTSGLAEAYGLVYSYGSISFKSRIYSLVSVTVKAVKAELYLNYFVNNVSNILREPF